MKASSLLAILFVSALAISPLSFATESSSRDGGGGDSTRERGDSADRGSRGELNHDNDTQSAENASAHHRSGGHPVGTLQKGEPSNPNYSFNKTKEEMKGHD